MRGSKELGANQFVLEHLQKDPCCVSDGIVLRCQNGLIMMIDAKHTHEPGATRRLVHVIDNFLQDGGAKTFHLIVESRHGFVFKQLLDECLGGFLRGRWHDGVEVRGLCLASTTVDPMFLVVVEAWRK